MAIAMSVPRFWFGDFIVGDARSERMKTKLSPKWVTWIISSLFIGLGLSIFYPIVGVTAVFGILLFEVVRFLTQPADKKSEFYKAVSMHYSLPFGRFLDVFSLIMIVVLVLLVIWNVFIK